MSGTARIFDWRGERWTAQWHQRAGAGGRGISFEDVDDSGPLVRTHMDAGQFAIPGEHELRALLEAALRRR
jgi:hypothetical protein